MKEITYESLDAASDKFIQERIYQNSWEDFPVSQEFVDGALAMLIYLEHEDLLGHIPKEVISQFPQFYVKADAVNEP